MSQRLLLAIVGALVVLYICFFKFGSISCDCSLAALEGIPGLLLNDETSKNNWKFTTTVDDQGIERCWITYKPPSCNNNNNNNNNSSGRLCPIVLDLHGNQACAYLPPFITGFRQKAEEEGFIIIWPQGGQNLPSSNNVGNRLASWNSYPKNDRTSMFIGATRANIDDVTFLTQVIDHTIHYAYPNHADPNRVYVTGHSNGCYMAQRFAAEASNRIAAMGCFAGHLVTPIPKQQQQQQHDDHDDDDHHHDGQQHHYVPVPIMVVHGTADALAKYDNTTSSMIDIVMGMDIPTAMQNIQNWAIANNCSTNTTTVTSSSTLQHQDDDDDDDGQLQEDFFEMIHYNEGCTNNASATLISLKGIGHFPYHEKYRTKIPLNSFHHFMARSNVGNYAFSKTVDTTTIVYNFMKQHSRDIPKKQQQQSTLVNGDDDDDDIVTSCNETIVPHVLSNS